MLDVSLKHVDLLRPVRLAAERRIQEEPLAAMRERILRETSR
jgi:hypothetical protein